MTMYKGSGSPFDYLIWNGDKLVGLECKIINDKAETKSFAFSRLSDVQREGLLKLDKMDNSEGLILVNFRWINNKKGKCFVLPITEFINLEYALADGKLKNEYKNEKSIPFEYFENCTLEIPRYKHGWNLKWLI